MKKLLLLAFAFMLATTAFGAMRPYNAFDEAASVKLNVSMATGHQATLTWTASTDAVSNPTLVYNVYRMVGQQCPASPTLTGFTKIATTVAGATGYNDVGIQPGTYCYSIQALLNGAESLPTTQSQASGVLLPQGPTATSVTMVP
jgi:hypothetical protein